MFSHAHPGSSRKWKIGKGCDILGSILPSLRYELSGVLPVFRKTVEHQMPKEYHTPLLGDKILGNWSSWFGDCSDASHQCGMESQCFKNHHLCVVEALVHGL